MRIIISPAKNLKENLTISSQTDLLFEAKCNEIIAALKSLNLDELKTLYKASDDIVLEAEKYIKYLGTAELFTAIHLFNGIQYTYMRVHELSDNELLFLNQQLFIISPLYGLIRPLDSINKYRLEMHAKLNVNGNKDMYDYWRNILHDELYKDNDVILNLCSEEYAKSIRKYLTKDNVFIDVSFLQDVNGRFKDLGTYSKMARGLMINFIAKNKIENVDDIKQFREDGYSYSEELSSPTHIIFIRSK